MDFEKIKLSKRDLELIHKIAERASKLLKLPLLSVEMDLTAVHSVSPLRLEDFLNAERIDFAHDVYGIQKNIDRSTGKLKNFFEPRFTDYPENKDEQ